MKLSYLNNKSWAEITREERVFCAELYFVIRDNPAPFLKLLGIDESRKYEIGYEVCFYRDVLKFYKDDLKGNGPSIKETDMPQKRTFDLTLMSDDEIIIIEAKANQGFDNKQLEDFDRDCRHIRELFTLIHQNCPQISIYAIHSDKYKPSDETRSFFTKLITWKDIAVKYPTAQDLFIRANSIYE